MAATVSFHKMKSTKNEVSSSGSKKNTSSPFISALAGATTGIFTELIFYGLDSYKVMRQANTPIVLSKIIKGAVPVAFMGSGPQFGVFFGLYGPMRDGCDNYFGPNNSSLSVLLASAIASIPSSISGIPADVLKKRLVLGQTQGVGQLAAQIYASEGWMGFFTAWQANLVKDIPFAGIKMSIYEGLARLYLKSFANKGSEEGIALNSDMLNKKEAALVGFGSGAVTGLLTCPLDCVNTRIKAGDLKGFGLLQAHVALWRREGLPALFRGVGPRMTILGLGSTVFWSTYAFILQDAFGFVS